MPIGDPRSTLDILFDLRRYRAEADRRYSEEIAARKAGNIAEADRCMYAGNRYARWAKEAHAELITRGLSHRY